MPASSAIGPFCIAQNATCCVNSYCNADETCCGGGCCPKVSPRSFIIFHLSVSARASGGMLTCLPLISSQPAFVIRTPQHLAARRTQPVQVQSSALTFPHLIASTPSTLPGSHRATVVPPVCLTVATFQVPGPAVMHPRPQATRLWFQPLRQPKWTSFLYLTLQ